MNKNNGMLELYGSNIYRCILQEIIMQKIMLLLLCVAFAGVTQAAPKSQKRCGWLVNPTPANWLLMDADGSWWFSAQGSPAYIPDEDWDNLPKMSERDYVKTNGDYGYSCACLNVRVDQKNKNIVRIYGGKTLPLKQCLADKKLPKLD